MRLLREVLTLLGLDAERSAGCQTTAARLRDRFLGWLGFDRKPSLREDALRGRNKDQTDGEPAHDIYQTAGPAQAQTAASNPMPELKRNQSSLPTATVGTLRRGSTTRITVGFDFGT